MRKFVLFMFFCAFAFGQMNTNAQVADSNQKHSVLSLPPIIVSGLEAYKDKGPEDAVRAWIKGSAIDGSKDALTQANNLRQIQDYYGAYRAYEVISTRDITPRNEGSLFGIGLREGATLCQVRCLSARSRVDSGEL